MDKVSETLKKYIGKDKGRKGERKTRNKVEKENFFGVGEVIS